MQSNSPTERYLVEALHGATTLLVVVLFICSCSAAPRSASDTAPPLTIQGHPLREKPGPGVYDPVVCDVVCPEGTTRTDVELKGAPAQVCLDAQGRKQGPSARGRAENDHRYCGSYMDDVEQGTWYAISPDLRLVRRTEYVDGQRHGTETTWFDVDGSPVAELREFRKGLLHGLWFAWYPNGQKAAEGRVDRGVYDGVWRRWAADGTEIGQFEIIDGTGTFRRWYDNGQLRLEGPLERGQDHGTWRTYDRDGNLIEECNYDRGEKLDCPVAAEPKIMAPPNSAQPER